MATGSAISPYIAEKLVGANPGTIERAAAAGVGLVSGEIVTPDPVQSIDLSQATPDEIQEHLDRINLYQQLSGRPAIFVYDPVAGHWVYHYTDSLGGSHYKGASA